MNFCRKKRVPPEISMTSMVDVVLLLLFFFMTCSTFSRQTEIKIKLPEADTATAEDYPDNVTLNIDADGAYYLQGKDGLPYELVNQQQETLIQALRKASANAEQTPFIINADGITPHQAVIKALEAASIAGFSHISFSALKPGSQP
ncbi:MAG: biopolymer transporter ExbD [Methylovulum sp.]|nr:biopolymer transporter ExbD [Methylovulum sp.]